MTPAVGDLMAKYVSTNAAAKALGVSVSTVKRWVDDGVLPAQKTAGGHRKLLIADVLQLIRNGELPHADLSHLATLPSAQRRAAPAKVADELYRQLLAGDEVRARATIHGEYRRGQSIDQLADLVIAPAMHRIGSDWQAGRIDVLEEHRASQICAAALYELKAVLENRATRPRPMAVGGATEGDDSVLPSLLAQMLLVDQGWDTVNLGPRTPLASFQRAIDELQPRLLWLTVSHLPDEAAFVASYQVLYRHAERAGVAIAIGGRAITDRIRGKIVFSAYGETMAHLSAFALSLHPRTRRPRRGRPPKE